MPMDSNTRRTVEPFMSEYCARRVPAVRRKDIKPGFRVRGNSVTLFDREQSFMDRSEWVEIPVAQFRFDPKSLIWTLYWPDRNIRWHLFFVVAPLRRLGDLVQAVGEDSVGAFQPL